MALMQCPECKKEVSSLCGRCPHCGFPVESLLRQMERENAAAAREEKNNRSFAKRFGRRAWIIAVTTASAAMLTLLALICVKFFAPPTYSATTHLYISSTDHSGDFNITISDLTVSQELINSYMAVMESAGTLEQVMDQAGRSYTYEELRGMLEIGLVNETEIFYIRVNAKDPQAAADIANACGYVFPKRIAGAIEGSTVKVVDYARAPQYPDPVNIHYEYVWMGAALAMAVSTAIVAATASQRRVKKENK